MSTANAVLEALQPYKLKQEGAGRYRCNSPFRAGSDSMAFTLAIHDDEHGAFFDHANEDEGSLYTLAKRLGIDVGSGATETKRAYQGMEDYAHAHGMPKDALEKALWKEVVTEGRKALEFITKGGKRWRYLDGEKPYYKSITGYKKCTYGLNQTALKRLAYGSPLVIVNGEISVIAGQFYGFASICITAGESDIPPDLVKEIHDFSKAIEDLRIVVALDCDEKGRRSSLQVKETLEKAGFASVRSADLQLGKGGDFADFCALYGVVEGDICTYTPLMELEKLPNVQMIQPKQRRRNWEIIHASELKNLPTIEWLVKGEIPEKSMIVLYGPSGTGKSFLALDYALRIAQFSSVVYMAGEGQAGYRGRVGAWCKYHLATEGQLYMCLGAVTLLDELDLQDFIQEVEKINKKPKFIIIDTLARSMLGADENSSRDMGYFIQACQEIMYHFGCSVMIVHHTSKAGAVERGSNALRGGADVMIKLTDEDDRIRVECAKTKDSKPFETYCIALLPVNIGLVDSDGNVVMPPVVILAEKMVLDSSLLTNKQRQVLEILMLESFEFGARLSDLFDAIPDANKSSLHRIVSNLKRMALVSQSAMGEPYCITEKGHALMSSHSDANQGLVNANQTGLNANQTGLNANHTNNLRDDSHDSHDSRAFQQIIGDLPLENGDANHANHANHANLTESEGAQMTLLQGGDANRRANHANQYEYELRGKNRS